MDRVHHRWGGQQAVRTLHPPLFTRHAAAIVASHCADQDRSAKTFDPTHRPPLRASRFWARSGQWIIPVGRVADRQTDGTVGSPLGQALGRLAQPDSGLARLVVEIASREITISRDRISDRLVSA